MLTKINVRATIWIAQINKQFNKGEPKMGTKASIMKFAIINDPKRLWDDGKKKVDNFYQMGKKINEAWEILLSQEIEDDVSEKLFQILYEKGIYLVTKLRKNMTKSTM